MTPKVGYVLPTREHIMTGRPEAAPLLDLAAEARAVGVDSVWVGDSLLARPRHEPLSLLAAIAVHVPDVILGTAVLLPVLRNPVLLAHQIATLDQISEGRLVIGFGIGPDTPGVRAEVQDIARMAGRDPGALTGAICLNLSIDDDLRTAERRLDDFVKQYYGVVGESYWQTHGCYAGSASGAADWLDGYAHAEVDHFILRFAGYNERHLETLSKILTNLGW